MTSTAPSNVSNTLGVLLGYLGGEVATKVLFERFLWPQRFYNGFGLKWSSFITVTMTMSLGGPLHRAALEVLDDLTQNGLMRGPQVGDFLGTVFFANTEAIYTTPPSIEQKDV